MRDNPPSYHPFRQLHLKLGPAWILLPLLGFVGVTIAAICYLCTDYQSLADWYRNLNPCFYRAADWQEAFFNPKTYRNGRIIAIVAGALSALLAGYMAWLFRKRKAWSLQIRYERRDLIAIAGILVLQALFWTWGMTHCIPGYDEVFSAMNCAGMHPFQCASYYMLPNNHVFFNLLNAFAGRVGSDPLMSARLIAAAASFAFAPLLYLWIRSRNATPIVAFLFTALVLLQFPVWAFGFQGRGYSLYLLCAWTAFVTVQLIFERRDYGALLPHILATLIGFWTMPSYLYWELAIVVYAAWQMIRQRRADWPIMRAFAISAALVFLAYAPILCFSGLPALAENRYVAARVMGFMKFLPELRDSIGSTMQYTFNGYIDHHNIVYVICFLVPLLLTPFCYRRRIFSSLVFLWMVWLSLLLAVLYSKRYPFPRNLIAHVNLSLVMLLLMANEALRLFRGRLALLRPVLACAACIAMGIHFARFDRDHIHDSIYFYQADTRFHSLEAAARRLPRDARVWVSQEGFYWQYLCRRRGLRASMCEGPESTHYIHIGNDEPLPPSIRDRAVVVDSADEYRILKIRR